MRSFAAPLVDRGHRWRLVIVARPRCSANRREIRGEQVDMGIAQPSMTCIRSSSRLK